MQEWLPMGSHGNGFGQSDRKSDNRHCALTHKLPAECALYKQFRMLDATGTGKIFNQFWKKFKQREFLGEFVQNPGCEDLRRVFRIGKMVGIDRLRQINSQATDWSVLRGNSPDWGSGWVSTPRLGSHNNLDCPVGTLIAGTFCNCRCID